MKNYLSAKNMSCTVFLAVVSCLSAATYNVSNLSELYTAVEAANASSDADTILIADGTYSLAEQSPSYIYITSDNVTIRSASGNRDNVIIQGDSMSADAVVSDIFLVAGDNFSISGVTLQKCRWHAIQVQGDADADYPVIRNCVFRDTYEQMLKVSYDFSNPTVGSDGGLVEGCLFEYTAGIGPQYYIGGIDALYAHNWTVRSNVFRNIMSPIGDIAQHSICFWHNCSGTLVECNLIINSDRGIGFGIGENGHSGGIIRNNMIYHDATSGIYQDAAIILDSSPNTMVYNNTCYMACDSPWTIEYRFPATTNVYIANNLVNREIRLRDSSSGTVLNNVTNAAASWFANVSAGDLHLATQVVGVVDSGIAIEGLVSDFDGTPRPQGSGIDIGADEYTTNDTSVVSTVTNVICDYDGDGTSDLAVYGVTCGVWQIADVGGEWTYPAVTWGGSGFVPVPGDYDGDGIEDLAVYHEQSGYWYIMTVTNSAILNGTGFGGPGYVPVGGDYNGDGFSDIAVYDMATGKWFVRSVSGSSIIYDVTYGAGNARPVSGDFDGDGKSDMALYAETSGEWHIRTVSGSTIADGVVVGGPGYTAVSGDYNGDRVSDYAVYASTSGLWYVKSVSGSVLVSGVAYGGEGWTPVSGDYDGDSVSDLAVYDVTGGTWNVYSLSGTNILENYTFGGDGYVPVACTYEELPSGLIPVYRLYSYGTSDATYEHLWTTSEQERDTMDSWPSWTYEGVAWYAVATDTGGSAALYRLYNSGIRQHHYTVDQNEYTVLDADDAWTGEGIQYYVWRTAGRKRMPVFRFFHTTTGAHHFTLDQDEKDAIMANPEWGYEYEGVAFYVYQADAADESTFRWAGSATRQSISRSRGF